VSAPAADPFADQCQAAVAHTRLAVDRLAASTGARLLPDLPETPWLAQLLDERDRLGTTGQLQVCEHLAGGQPQPIITAAWRRGLEVCLACAGALQPDAVEAQTCDVCRRHQPGRVRDVSWRVGELLVLAGWCRDCGGDDVARQAGFIPTDGRACIG
jgi:hypothetical protein